MMRIRLSPSFRRLTSLGLLMAASLLGCSLAEEPVPEPVDLRVLTYNLRHDADFYEDRMVLIADGIAALAPDLIALQEVEIAVEQGERLVEMIAERDPSLDYELHQALKPNPESGEGVGIMSRQPTSDLAVLELVGNRVSLFARLPDVNGHSLAFVSTHLTSAGGIALRVEQTAATLAFFEEHAAPEDARVLAGDFNALHDSETISNVLEEGYTDTYLAVHGPEVAAKQGLTSQLVLGTDQSEQHLRFRIDYVFSRSGERTDAQPIESEVVLNEPREDGLYPSDHLGVMTTLRLSRVQ